MDPTRGTENISFLEIPEKMTRDFPAAFTKITRAVEGGGERELYEMILCTSNGVKRWFGREVLDLSKAAVDTTYLKAGAALLLNHSTDQQIGVIEEHELEATRLIVRFRFSSDPVAQQVKRDVDDEIRRFASVGYSVDEYKLTKSSDTEGDEYTATRWTPLEGSIVPVPADPTARLRANDGMKMRQVQVRGFSQPAPQGQNQEVKMEKVVTTPAPDAGQAAAVVIVKAGEGARSEGSAEVMEILELCRAHGHMEHAHDYIQRKLTPAQVGQEILKARASQPIAQPGAEQIVPMREMDARRYSYSRAILLGLGDISGGIEAEVDAEIRRQLPGDYKTRGGIMVPLSLRRPDEGRLVRAGHDSLTTGKGKETIFDTPGDFIEMLRNNSVAVRRGARTLVGLAGPVTFVRQTGAMVVSWVAENPGGDVADTELTLDTVALTPKTIQGSGYYSRQLLAQNVFSVEQMVREDLASGHALAWDLASLHGTGASNQPTGLYVAAGVNSVTFGGVPTFGKLVDMTTEVAKDNAIAGSLGWATTPGMAGKLMQTLVASAAGSNMIWSGTHENGQLLGYGATSSNQVRADLGTGSDHGIVYGNWNSLMIGMWGAMELIVDPYSKKKRALIEVTSFQMCDIALRYVQSFCKALTAVIA